MVKFECQGNVKMINAFFIAFCAWFYIAIVSAGASYFHHSLKINRAQKLKMPE